MTSRNFLFSFLLWVFYIGAVETLSLLQGLPWGGAQAFWVGIVYFPLWVKVLSAATILAGTLMIYFVPGVFIASRFGSDNQNSMEIFLKGFLINYSFYYLSTTIIKAGTGHAITREIMMLLIGAGTVLGSLLVWLLSSKNKPQHTQQVGANISHKSFLLFYAIFLIGIFYIFQQKIFFTPFNGDGAEQYWLAHSLKSNVLPTGYRSPLTIIPQFPFAPSIYLNMFALTLFGNAEFIVRISVLVAFMALGLVLKELVREFLGNKPFGVKESIPLLLYMLIMFIIIAFRADYVPPVDLTKSSETLIPPLFFSGFYLLLKRGKNADVLAAICFVAASMIRYNGFFMTVFFLIGFSILFKRWKCFLWYVAGVIFVVLALNLSLITSAYTFKDMLLELLSDIRGLREEGFSARFVWAYLRNYFIFTAGLSVFLMAGIKNRYVLLMSLTTLFFLILPLRSDVVPAHYFIPIFVFPLLSAYLAGAFNHKMITKIVILMELISLIYVFPKVASPRAVAFENTWSRLCVNTTDLFEATRRWIKLRPFLYFMDDRVSMYYADFMPKANKKYLLYVETLPSHESSNYDLATQGGQKIYLPKGLTWDEFIRQHTYALEEYLQGNPPFIVRRKDIDPYGEFRSLSRDHGKK